MAAFLDFDDIEESAGVGEEEDIDWVGPRETNEDEEEEEGAGDDGGELMKEELGTSAAVEREEGTDAVRGNLFKYTVDHSSRRRLKNTLVFSTGVTSSLDGSWLE